MEKRSENQGFGSKKTAYTHFLVILQVNTYD